MNALNNMKISVKLVASFLVIGVLLVAVAVMGYSGTKTINDDLTTMYSERLVPIDQLWHANAAFYEQRGDVLKFILVPSERGAIKQDINAQYAAIESEMGLYSATYLVKEEKEELASFNVAWTTYRKAVADTLAAAEAGNDKAAIASISEGGAYYSARTAIGGSLAKLINTNLTIADELNRQGDGTFASATLVLGVLSVVAVVLAVIIGVVLSRGIASPLARIASVAIQISEGNLAVNLPAGQRRDEIGELAQSFHRMVETLRQTTSDISQAAAQLSSSVSEILAATTQVASGAAETATSISETTTTVEEVRQAAKLSSQKAQYVSDNAQRVDRVSQSGQMAVEATAAGMDHTREQMETIAQTIVRLNEQSQSIGEINATVTDLASQSNLLAVNAAIEAARAGEQGKGFVVLAQEIRSMAEQSKLATAQVRSILNDVQKATSNAVTATERGSEAVEAGVKQATQAGEAIRTLAETSGEAVQAAIQIVASSQQQMVGMDQVALAMENINLAGAQNASAMKQMEVAAHDMQELGQKLKELVARFRV